MAAHSKSMEAQASPDRVWKIWSDVSTWPHWNPDVQAIEINGPFASGTTGTMTTRSGGSHAITLQGVEPGRSFRLETAAIPLTRFAFRCEVMPSGANASTISQSLTMHGALAPVFSAMMGKRIAESFEPILSGLKAEAEKGAG
jgi:polyketide cyclase/dehydrase/lipid transport protein